MTTKGEAWRMLQVVVCLITLSTAVQTAAQPDVSLQQQQQLDVQAVLRAAPFSARRSNASISRVADTSGAALGRRSGGVVLNKGSGGPAVEGGAVGLGGQDTGCKCIEYDCGCCAHVSVKEIHLDDTVCVNVSYLPKDYGVALTLTVDKRTLLNITVSARNPPPICVGIPYLEAEASLCVELYDLDFTPTTFSGCVRLEARLFHIVLSKLSLGCFHFPLHGVHDVRGLQGLLGT